MRWIPFLILAYVVMLLETSMSRLLFISVPGLGSIGPDLAAMVVVFVALYTRSAADAMIAGWVLGLAVDLTSGGGIGAMTVVGPMSIAYCLLAGQLWRVREAFFRERAVTQVVLTLFFALGAHFIWVTVQALAAPGEVTLGDYGLALIQAAGIACYTAVLMPLAHFALIRVQRVILTNPAGPSRGRR